jgi:iron complex transport system ATP-binding protein
MLRAEQLTVRRSGRCLLQSITLRLTAGQVVGVLGPNGAGKSSLIGALTGELPADSGELWLNQRRLADWSPQQRAIQLAVLPQQSALRFGFSVESVVALGRLPHVESRCAREQAVTQALDALDLGAFRQRNYLQLSGGEQQRVQLARILAQLWPVREGQVLLLDEPLSMLDPQHQQKCLQEIRRLASSGVAVLLVLHDLNLAARYCDQLLVVQEGVISAQGTPEQVLTEQHLERLFGVQVLIQTHPLAGHPLVLWR